MALLISIKLTLESQHEMILPDGYPDRFSVDGVEYFFAQEGLWFRKFVSVSPVPHLRTMMMSRFLDGSVESHDYMTLLPSLSPAGRDQLLFALSLASELSVPAELRELRREFIKERELVVDGAKA